MKSNSTWFDSLKLFLISAGIVSLAVGVRFFVPAIIHGVVHEIPALWSILLSWLKPPYLYVIINGIIIIIAAASRFHHRESEPSVEPENLISVKTPPPLEFASIPTPTEISTVVEEPPAAVETALVCESEDGAVEVKDVVVNDSEVMENDDVAEAEDEDDFIVSNSTYSTPPQGTISPPFLLPIREKPLASSRFGNHRKNLKSSPEGTKALRVARPKTQETLESTWKMITEGRPVPLTRQWKKQDTWKDHEQDMTGNHSNLTNKNHVNHDSPRAPLSSYPSLKVRKELSVGHEELNRRVEAFIKKFNEEMRMQRQESLNQYMEMINRGV
ncbi:unnamed protein product [Fraxinus pennsylvanica]|uniref:DUF4408 domain-containing protein n=1 Tax=Fraxinus pennsylvanica TaxID=56036 RepID=A0AAD2E2Y2_9LAMI|nr:unnamed protein product [Fraxinus pennsylvanica]